MLPAVLLMSLDRFLPMCWFTLYMRMLLTPRLPVQRLGIATLLLTLWSAPALAADARTLAFSEIGNLDIKALDAQLTKQRQTAPGAQNTLRLLLFSADLRRDTPDHASEALATAIALLGPGPEQEPAQPPGTLLHERAYADALRCDLAHRTGSKTRDVASCEQLTTHLQSVSDTVVRTALLRTLALVRYRSGRLAEALDLSRLALDAAQAAKVPILIAQVHKQRGTILREYGLPEQALASFDRARAAISDERPSFMRSLDVLIGSSQLEIQQAEPALESFLRGLEWAERTGASQLAVRLRDFTARAYLQLGAPETAVQYLEGVFAGPVPQLSADYSVSARATLARAYQARGEIERANATFEAALSLAREVNNDSRRRAVTLAFAEALTDQQQPQRALHLLEPLINELQQIETTLHLVAALDVQSQANAQLQQFEAAYAAQSRSRELQRQLQSANFERSLSYQRAELEVHRQADELDLLRAREASLEAQSQLNRALVVALVLLSVCGALLIYLWMYRRLQRQAAAASEVASKELESLVIARTQALENELASRLLLEEERRQLEVNMAEGDKLRTIGQLTSGVAHDFNNLMTVITLSAELLAQSDQPLTEAQQQCVDDILLASDSGSNVTSGLLAYARQQSLEPESVELHDYIRQSEPLFRRTLGEGIDLRTDLQQVPLTIDKANLTTALINLMVNAKEATGGRGRVQLRTELLRNHAGPSGNCAAPADWVRISVADNGRGMSATERQRAIEPFYTTKNGGKGSGLGLSMVYGFAKQSGGDIDIEAPASGGARIVLWLPSAAARAVPTTTPAVTAEIPISSGATVWLVEDQHALRLTMRRLLESMGLVVEAIDNADRAAELMLQQAPPDLLLSDVIMPGTRTGNELADEMRKRYPQLPVLLMSGYTDLVEIDYPILQKPFSLEELRNRVAEALAAEPSAKAS